MKPKTRLNSGDIDNLLPIIREKLLTYPSIVFAYLYGSAREVLVVGDIDIAVYFNHELLPEKQIDISLSLSISISAKLGMEVDVRPINNTDVGYRYDVTRGEVLFSHDEDMRTEFVERTWQEYFDFKPLMEQNLRDLLEP